MASPSSPPIKTPVPIVFLKTPTTPTDAYTTVFSSSTATHPLLELPKSTSREATTPEFSYEPHYVPILQHTYDLEQLLDILHQPTFPFDALIFTSQRAVSALEQACGILHKLDQWGSNSSKLEIPLYVVGPATAHCLREIGARYFPRCQVRGEQAGTGEALAEIILNTYRDDVAGVEELNGNGRNTTVGFVTGEKHRDVIPDRLRRAGVIVEEIVVYRTSAQPDFSGHLRKVLEDVETIGESRWLWVVFFSAFAASEVLRCIGALDEETGKVSGVWYEDVERKIRVAAIGPTTADTVKRQYELNVDAVAESPSPEGIKAAVETFMSGSRSHQEGFPVGS